MTHSNDIDRTFAALERLCVRRPRLGWAASLGIIAGVEIAGWAIVWMVWPS